MTSPRIPFWPAAAFIVACGAAACLLLGPALAGAGPAQEPAPGGFPEELRPYAQQWIAEFFPGDPAAFAENLSDPLARRVALGRQVFERYCVGCHGENADGQGAAAPMLVPRPRNFRYSLDPDTPPIFKFRSTASGQPPLKADLVRTITQGLDGSSMPAHRLVDAPDLSAVADYVLWVAQTSEFGQAIRRAYADEEPDLEDEEDRQYFLEDFVAEEARIIRERFARPALLVVGPEPEGGQASLDRGGEVYTEAGCFECHGRTGRGDGSSAPTLVDTWGFPVDPRDFSTGRFRAGSTGRDLYLRIKGGVTGTPMPAFDYMSNDDLWHLVHFIQSMAGGVQ